MKKLWLDIQTFVYASLLRMMWVEKYWQYRAQEIQAKTGRKIPDYQKLNWKHLRRIVLMMEKYDKTQKKGITIMNNEEFAVRFLKSRMGFKPAIK